MSENWDTTQLLTTVAWFLLGWRRSEDQPPGGGPRCRPLGTPLTLAPGQCVIELHQQLIISQTNNRKGTNLLFFYIPFKMLTVLLTI